MTDERQIANWKASPYTGVRKRHRTVEHRIVAVNEPGVGVDIRHETRSEDAGQPEWTPVEVWEFRAHGVDKRSKGEWHEFPDVGGGRP